MFGLKLELTVESVDTPTVLLCVTASEVRTHMRAGDTEMIGEVLSDIPGSIGRVVFKGKNRHVLNGYHFICFRLYQSPFNQQGSSIPTVKPLDNEIRLQR